MKELEQYPGYFVTETGEFYSSKTNCYLKQSITNRGYKKLNLQRDGRKVTVRSHRLVAEAFIPNPHNLPEVDHIDGDKTNNNVSNLRWITTQENTEKSQAKHYLVETPSGEVVTIYNLKKYCRDNNLHPWAIRQHYGSKGYKIIP